MTLLARCRGDTYLARDILAHITRDRDTCAAFRATCREHRAMIPTRPRTFTSAMSSALYMSAMRDGQIALMRATQKTWIPGDQIQILYSRDAIHNVLQFLRESFYMWFVAIFGYDALNAEIRADRASNAMPVNIIYENYILDDETIAMLRKLDRVREMTDDILGVAQLFDPHLQPSVEHIKPCASLGMIAYVLGKRRAMPVLRAMVEHVSPAIDSFYLMAFAIGICDSDRAPLPLLSSLSIQDSIIEWYNITKHVIDHTYVFPNYLSYFAMPRYGLLFVILYPYTIIKDLVFHLIQGNDLTRTEINNMWLRCICHYCETSPHVTNKFPQLFMEGNIELMRNIISLYHDEPTYRVVSYQPFTFTMHDFYPLNMKMLAYGIATCEEIFDGGFDKIACLREILNMSDIGNDCEKWLIITEGMELSRYHHINITMRIIGSISSSAIFYDEWLNTEIWRTTVLSAHAIMTYCEHIIARVLRIVARYKHVVPDYIEIWSFIARYLASRTITLSCHSYNPFDITNELADYLDDARKFARMTTLTQIFIYIARKLRAQLTGAQDSTIGELDSTEGCAQEFAKYAIPSRAMIAVIIMGSYNDARIAHEAAREFGIDIDEQMEIFTREQPNLIDTF